MAGSLPRPRGHLAVADRYGEVGRGVGCLEEHRNLWERPYLWQTTRRTVPRVRWVPHGPGPVGR